MTAIEVLTALEAVSVAVTVDGDRLRLRPASRVTPALVDQVRAVKPELVSLLRDATGSAVDGAVAARVAVFRTTGSPWLFVPGLPYSAGACFSCGAPNPDVIYGRCAACSEALWRVLMQQDLVPWPGRPQ